MENKYVHQSYLNMIKSNKIRMETVGGGVTNYARIYNLYYHCFCKSSKLVVIS